MTEKGTPPLPDPSPTLSPARAEEREKKCRGRFQGTEGVQTADHAVVTMVWVSDFSLMLTS